MPATASHGPGPGPPAPTRDAPRILIVRPSALGDVARSVPALASLRQACPEATIDWLVASPFVDIVAHHPMLDGVIPFDRKALSGFGFRPGATRAGLALAKKLRRARYDVVYDLQGLARSGLLTWLTRAPRRVGFAGAREGAALGYNIKHQVPDSIHTVDRMLGLLTADGLTANKDMRLYTGPADQTWASDFINQHGLTPGRYVCLAPTAQWGCKCWPAERYAALARRVIDLGKAGEKIVVLAAPSEHPKLGALIEELGDNVLLPKTSVGQLAALIQGSALVVANDSAALHIAVGLDRPAVALFGPTDPARVGPYGRADDVIQPPGLSADDMQRYRKHKHDDSLIARIEVQTVWDKVVSRLG